MTNSRKQRWLLLTLACLLLGSPLQADDTQLALTAARTALAKRDLPAAEAKLDALAKSNPSQLVADEIERLQTLHNYLTQFWQAVDRGGSTLAGGEELEIGSTRVVVVEYAKGRLVIRHNGVNKRYTLADMPGKLVLTLVSRSLKFDSGPNKVIVASFLAVDTHGEREMARKMLEDARKLGTDTSVVEPELSTEPIVGGKLKVPPLTPAVRALLALDNWQLRQTANGRAVLETLGDLGAKTANHRLLVSRPADAIGNAAVVFQRRVSGNFTCRVMLLDVTGQQQFALYPASAGDALIAVPLPTGNVQIQLSRRGTQLFCELNGEKLDLSSPAGANLRESGYLGLSLPAGQASTIAWFELLNR